MVALRAVTTRVLLGGAGGAAQRVEASKEEQLTRDESDLRLEAQLVRWRRSRVAWLRWKL